MMCITVGFTGGAMLAGAVSLWLIPAFGWRSMFVFGGADSTRHRAADGVGPAGIAAVPGGQAAAIASRWPTWLQEARPDASRIDATTEFVANEERGSGVPAVHLFRNGRGVGDAAVVGRQLHEPADAVLGLQLAADDRHRMGYNAQIAVWMGLWLQVGGTIGAFGLAWLIARGDSCRR
jgi:AAHS family 4-hydroxybenzoate transporter-like MFS transporter